MKILEYKELFQRVEGVARILSGSIPQMAKTLGKEYRTFKGYLCEKRQDNLWPLLPDILEAYPRLSRQWLYFGEGPMLIGQGVPLDQPVPMQEVATAAEAMAADCGGSWSKVLQMIVGRAQEEEAAHEKAPTDPTLLKDLVEAQKEALRLAKKVEALLEENAELRQQGLSTAEDPKNCAGRTAPISPTAARGTPGGSD